MKKIVLLFVVASMITNVSGQIISSWKSNRVDPTNNKYYKIGTISLPNNYYMFNGTFCSSFQQIGSSMETSFIKYSISARNTNGSIILKITHNGSSGKDNYSANVIGLINGTTIDIYTGGINASYQYPSHSLLGYSINVGGTFTKIENDGGTTTLPSGTQVIMNKSLFIDDSGNVGIGTISSDSKLSVYGSTAEGWNSGIELNREGGGKGWIVVDSEGMKFRTPVDGDGFYFLDNDNNTSFFIKDGGNAFLNGKFEAKEIKVQLAPTADFVFQNDYKLKELEEVESFIKENKHLPDFPSGKEIEGNGVNLGEMDAKLLQKIEELTLYIIEQNKRIEKLENKLEKNGIQ